MIEDTEYAESESDTELARSRSAPIKDIRKLIIYLAVCLLASALAFALGIWLGRGALRAKTVTPTDILNGGVYALKRATVQLVQTAQDYPERLQSMAPQVFEKDFEFSGPTINFMSSRPAPNTHEFEGFGGAFTESAALVFEKLSPDQKQEVLEKYFGEDGLGYTLGRTHINSCDFSTENYAFDTVEGDVSLQFFDTGVTRDAKALIPFIKVAKEMIEAQPGKKLKLLATPWSPPAWMKTNGQMDHSDIPCLKTGMQLPWAEYFTKWISAYKAHGVPIWAITMQNEPENNATWEGCLFNYNESMQFIEVYLGPQLQLHHDDVKLFVFDHNKDTVYDWAKAAYSKPLVEQYVYGVAYHWYMGDGFDKLHRIRNEFPQAALLASEATWERWRWKEGTTLSSGDWTFGEGYAHDIIGDLNAGSIGWIDWNLLLDQDGGPNHVDNVCDAVAMANLSTGELFWHPQYDYIGHFSKYIPQGSRLIETQVTGSRSYTGKSTYGCKKGEENCRGYGVCTGDDGLEATAFLRPDESIVVVALNCGDDPVVFKIKYGPNALRAALPKHAIQTYIFEPAENATKIVI